MSIRINTELYRSKPDMYAVGTWRFFDQDAGEVYESKGIYWLSVRDVRDHFIRTHDTNYGILFLLGETNDKTQMDNKADECTSGGDTTTETEEDRRGHSNVLEFRRPNRKDTPRLVRT